MNKDKWLLPFNPSTKTIPIKLVSQNLFQTLLPKNNRMWVNWTNFLNFSLQHSNKPNNVKLQLMRRMNFTQNTWISLKWKNLSSISNESKGFFKKRKNTISFEKRISNLWKLMKRKFQTSILDSKNTKLKRRSNWMKRLCVNAFMRKRRFRPILFRTETELSQGRDPQDPQTCFKDFNLTFLIVKIRKFRNNISSNPQ